jgi:hypothetical protein
MRMRKKISLSSLQLQKKREKFYHFHFPLYMEIGEKIYNNFAPSKTYLKIEK